MDKRLAELSYEILPGRGVKLPAVRQKYDAAFAYWRSFWEGVLAEVDAAARLSFDDFLRQDRIALLTHGEAVVGMHLLQIFDLDSGADTKHSFVQRYFDAGYLATMERMGVRTVLSLEYLTLDPAWRGSVVGLSLAKVVIALSLRLADEMGVDAAVGAARCDVGVAKMVAEQGATKVGETVLVHGIPTDVVAFPRRDVRAPKDEAVQALISRLWAQRHDHTQVSMPAALRAVA